MGIDDSSLAAGGATDPFLVGQKQDTIDNLGDPRQSDGTTPAWDEHFLQDLHGLILIAGDSHATIEKKRAEIDLISESTLPQLPSRKSLPSGATSDQARKLVTSSKFSCTFDVHMNSTWIKFRFFGWNFQPGCYWFRHGY